MTLTHGQTLSVPGETPVNYRVEVNAEEAAVIVLDEVVAVKITLTSPLLRETGDPVSKPEDGASTSAAAETDFLPREPCLRVSTRGPYIS